MIQELRIFPKQRNIPEKKPKSFILYPFEMWEKRRETFEQKEAESLELIINHFKVFKNPHIMTSHGNDSVILCHLAIRACNVLDIPLPQFWLNNTLNLFKEEKEYWNRINEFLGIENNFKIFMPPKDDKGRYQTVWSIADKVGHLPSFRKTAKHKSMSYKHTNTPECCDILKKESVKDYLKKLPENERYDLVLIGTRAEESQMRSLGVLQRCRSYLQKTRTPYPKQVLTPLSFWHFTDIEEYYNRYNIPRNPVYQTHNVDRMGCASCPAHIGWEIRLAKDPTEEGFGMLKQNLTIIQKTILAGTEEPERLDNTIKSLQKYIKSNDSKTLSENMRNRLIDLIADYTNQLPITKLTDSEGKK